MTTEKIKVVIKAKLSSGVFRAYVDEKRIHFENGEAVLEMEPRDKDYVLTWFIHDSPGAKYGIEISEPASIKMIYKTTLDASSKDAGIYWFKI